jgi:alpha-beta hydrolase superfamily lysophospholipase
MAVECAEQTISLDADKIHIYLWTEPSVPARRIVVLIHGMMMHGKSYDSLARHLAAGGAIVVAPDLRGFGRWYFASEGEKGRTSFSKSQEDLSKLFHLLEDQHQGLPLFCAGESLGSHFARRTVALHPELVAGLILSSACVRPKMVSFPLIPHTWSELVLTGLDPSREVNLSPFARQFLKDEPDNLQRYLDDPMSRKSLEVLELIDSLRIANLPEKLDRVPRDLPVLVLRGKNDCLCQESSTKKFIDSLNSDKLTVHSFAGCGHLILQAADIGKDVSKLIDGWMQNVETSSV